MAKNLKTSSDRSKGKKRHGELTSKNTRHGGKVETELKKTKERRREVTSPERALNSSKARGRSISPTKRDSNYRSGSRKRTVSPNKQKTDSRAPSQPREREVSRSRTYREHNRSMSPEKKYDGRARSASPLRRPSAPKKQGQNMREKVKESNLRGRSPSPRRTKQDKENPPSSSRGTALQGSKGKNQGIKKTSTSARGGKTGANAKAKISHIDSRQKETKNIKPASKNKKGTEQTPAASDVVSTDFIVRNNSETILKKSKDSEGGRFKSRLTNDARVSPERGPARTRRQNSGANMKNTKLKAIDPGVPVEAEYEVEDGTQIEVNKKGKKMVVRQSQNASSDVSVHTLARVPITKRIGYASLFASLFKTDSRKIPEKIKVTTKVPAKSGAKTKAKPSKARRRLKLPIQTDDIEDGTQIEVQKRGEKVVILQSVNASSDASVHTIVRLRRSRKKNSTAKATTSKDRQEKKQRINFRPSWPFKKSGKPASQGHGELDLPRVSDERNQNKKYKVVRPNSYDKAAKRSTVPDTGPSLDKVVQEKPKANASQRHTSPASALSSKVKRPSPEFSARQLELPTIEETEEKSVVDTPSPESAVPKRSKPNSKPIHDEVKRPAEKPSRDAKLSTLQDSEQIKNTTATPTPSRSVALDSLDQLELADEAILPLQKSAGNEEHQPVIKNIEAINTINGTLCAKYTDVAPSTRGTVDEDRAKADWPEDVANDSGSDLENILNERDDEGPIQTGRDKGHEDATTDEARDDTISTYDSRSDIQRDDSLLTESPTLDADEDQRPNLLYAAVGSILSDLFYDGEAEEEKLEAEEQKLLRITETASNVEVSYATSTEDSYLYELDNTKSLSSTSFEEERYAVDDRVMSKKEKVHHRETLNGNKIKDDAEIAVQSQGYIKKSDSWSNYYISSRSASMGEYVSSDLSESSSSFTSERTPREWTWLF